MPPNTRNTFHLDEALDAYRTQAESIRTSAPAKAAAFTAAAGAALALAPSADAAIQYSGRQDILIDLRTDNDPLTPAVAIININAATLFTAHSLADSIPEFSFELGSFSAGQYVTAAMNKAAFGLLDGQGVVMAPDLNSKLRPARLSGNVPVSNLAAPTNLRFVSTSGSTSGNWFGGTMSFGAAHFLGVGFKIPTGGATNSHIGWIRIGIDTNDFGQPIAMTIYDWAWEDVPDTQIVTGAIPEPTPTAGLALLAAGAAGVAVWRRRKAASA